MNHSRQQKQPNPDEPVLCLNWIPEKSLCQTPKQNKKKKNYQQEMSSISERHVLSEGGNSKT